MKLVPYRYIMQMLQLYAILQFFLTRTGSVHSLKQAKGRKSQVGHSDLWKKLMTPCKQWQGTITASLSLDLFSNQHQAVKTYTWHPV